MPDRRPAMLKTIIGMIKMKKALKKLAGEDLTTYPEGYSMFCEAMLKMGPMGMQLTNGLIKFLVML